MVVDTTFIGWIPSTPRLAPSVTSGHATTVNRAITRTTDQDADTRDIVPVRCDVRRVAGENCAAVRTVVLSVSLCWLLAALARTAPCGRDVRRFHSPVERRASRMNEGSRVGANVDRPREPNEGACQHRSTHGTTAYAHNIHHSGGRPDRQALRQTETDGEREGRDLSQSQSVVGQDLVAIERHRAIAKPAGPQRPPHHDAQRHIVASDVVETYC
jgi:hypothetical protein